MAGATRPSLSTGSLAEYAVFEADTAWPDDDFPDTIYEDLPSGRYVLQVHQLAEQQGEVRIEITCP